MIRNTFSIFDGIACRTEKKLWKHGIITWDDFLKNKTVPYMNNEKKRVIDEIIFYYLKELESRNSAALAKYVKRLEHWRFYDLFKNDAVCIDIETNGYSFNKGGYTTVVGLYNGKTHKYFIKGKNLSIINLQREFDKYKYIISFYGSVFDMPFLKKEFPSLKANMLHFDICLASRKIGMKGGLKKLEKTVGIYRDEDVEGMDGYEAVHLWKKYRLGDTDALNLLISYNKDDTVNLYKIAEYIYNKLKKATGIEKFVSDN